MSIEAISEAYSPDIIYGRLSSPFTPKQKVINAHTPLDEPTEENRTFNMDDFVKGGAKMRVTIERKETETLNYPPKKSDKVEFPPKIKVGTDSVKGFSASSANSGKDLVKGALTKGYSTEEAITIARAKEAYSKSVGINTDPVGTLKKVSYRVV